jgi:hypothetical protein
MAGSKNPIKHFRTEIRKIIAEIEACIRVSRSTPDREYEFQRRAFEERCGQAEQLTTTLEPAASGGAKARWSVRDGDAHRIQESLKLSLDFFRGVPGSQTSD